MNTVAASIIAGVCVVIIVALLGFILRSSLWIAQAMKDNGHDLAELVRRVDRLEGRYDTRSPRLEVGDDG